MTNTFLSFFNKPGLRWVLSPLISLMYARKGLGFPTVRYHDQFRMWEFRIKGISYLSTGPGWAYCYEYLNGLLKDTYTKYCNLERGDCVVDLGAGLGEEAVIFAQLVGPQGRVHAIEAHPVVFEALNYMRAQNNFSQLVTHHLAIADRATTVQIEDSPGSYVGNSIGSASGNGRTFSVNAVTFDSFVGQNGITRIDLLKSNIEGAEQFLILGMSKSLAIIKFAAISCHDFRTDHGDGEFYATHKKVTRYFTEQGFRVFSLKTGNNINDLIVYAANPNIPR